MMLTAVLSGYLAAILAPWIHRAAGGRTGWILSLLPFGMLISFVRLIEPVAAGRTMSSSYPWVPSLGITLSFMIDGLSLIFALLITGIGALVLIYAGGYLAGHGRLGRFYAVILLFMSSMLGLVLADNVITLFMFWELTSITSYLLIGFDHERGGARSAALQALLVTGVGGLALLAGLILLAQSGGTMEMSGLLIQGDVVRSHRFYPVILLLVLAGAFTKSAQVPFHFWLPGAMEAPTPVSAYLHSATMVKAGVYLLARLSPVLGGTDAWHYLVTVAGAATMVTGAIIALAQTDLKRLLAYSTVSALGTLVLLIGLDTTLSMKAAMVFLVVHSLYKAALFLMAGAVDHETGTRDIRQLGGLRRVMPITAVAAGLAALSMAGLPPLLGFISKELIYEAKLQAPRAGWMITGAGVLANVLIVAVAGMVGIRPFLGKTRSPVKPHEAPISLWLGPILLGSLGLLIGLLPDVIGRSLVSAAVSASRAELTEVRLALWHGLNPVLVLSLVTLLCGVAVYAGRTRLGPFFSPLRSVARAGPTRWYQSGLDGMMGLARVQTAWLQNGYLRSYLLLVILTTIGLTGSTLLREVEINWAWSWSDVRIYEATVALVVLSAALAAVRSSSRLAAIAALGVVGYGIALMFLFFGAPDLAMTQFAIETLTVILFVLVLYRLPRFATFTRTPARIRDAVVALCAGAMMTGLVLAATSHSAGSSLTSYFAELSFPLAKGRNVVNVILVDFRAMDTLGEITVLAAAAIGVFALLRLRLEERESR